ncbi:MAG TPA: hypothetical protein VIF57_14495 [Polyangia bacterium]
MRWTALWIALGVVVAGAAATGWLVGRFALAPLHTRAMPGFEIDLPDGEVADKGSGYRKGKLTIHDVNGVPSFVMVKWEPGGLSSDEDIEQSAKAMAAVQHVEARSLSVRPDAAVAGKDRRSWAARFGHSTFWETEVVCGARVVTLETESDRWGVERLHRRVAASFRCRPDPVKEQLVGDTPVTFDVGEGWYRVKSPPGEVQLTDRKTILGARLFGVQTLNDETLQALATVIPGFEVGDRVDDDWKVRMPLGKRQGHGWLTLRRCRDAGASLFITALAFDAGQTVDRALLTRVHCRNPGEAAQTWPELPHAAAVK